MLRLAATTMRGNARRMLSAGLAILLGVGFVATTLLLSASLQGSIERRIAGSVGAYAAIAHQVETGTLPGAGPARLLPDAGVAKIREIAGVTGVEAIRAEPFELRSGDGASLFMVRTDAPPTVVAGRLPAGPGEIALDGLALSSGNVAVGSTVKIATLQGTDRRPVTRTVRVVGQSVAPADPRSAAMPSGYAPQASIAAWTGRAGYTEIRVSGPDPHEVKAAIAPLVATAAGAGWQVQTGPQRAATLVSRASAQTTMLASLLLTFASVALFVCGLVIANTFTIMLTQRSRQLALLRCVGAARRQVFASTVVEALVVGFAASVGGVMLALGATFVATQLPVAREFGLETMTVTPSVILVPLLVGPVVTLLASAVPAWKATRVAPLAALRPAPAAAAVKLGWGRVGLGSVTVAVGAGLLAVGAVNGRVEIGIAGGALSFLGVLIFGPLIVPALVATMRRPAGRLFGNPGRLAVDNARRNPARAAATSSALLVGVTLITMMLVGAATGREVATQQIDREYPLDVAVATTDAAGVPASTLEAVRRVPGVEVVGAVAAQGDGQTLAPARGGEQRIGVRFTPGSDSQDTLQAVHRAVAKVPSAQVSGAAPMRAELNAQIDIVLAVVIALLAVSVVIALVGVGNTLGLSVLERTRESALLRALGLSRGQLRGALAIEALLLAGVGVVLGVGLGVVYGWAGTAALFGVAVESVPLSLPWGRVAIAVAVALAAGVAASVLPARRAARIAPAQALGD